MPIDPSFLLQSQGVQLPDPVKQFSTMIGLRDLVNKVQTSDMALEQQRQYQAAVQKYGANANFDQVAPQIAQEFPLAFAKMASDRKLLEGTDAEIGVKRATAAKDRAEAFAKANAILSNAASSIASQNRAPTPMEQQYLAKQAEQAAIVGGRDPSSLSLPPLGAAPDVWAAWTRTVASGGVSALDQASIGEKQAQTNKINTLLPGEVAQQGATLESTRAGTRKTNYETDAYLPSQVGRNLAETAAIPMNAQSQRISANAAASNAQTARLNADRVQHVSVDGGLYTFDPKSGMFSVGKDANGQPVTVPGKNLPEGVQNAMLKNVNELRKIDQAIELVNNDESGAIGWKNQLPFAPDVRNYTNPEGTDARAAVGNIGSVKIHDISGAAVTISETPRLKPWIPLVTDPPEVAKAKLNRLGQEYRNMLQDQARAFGAGYKQNPVVQDAVNAPAATGPKSKSAGGKFTATDRKSGKSYSFPDEASARAAQFEFDKQ